MRKKRILVILAVLLVAACLMLLLLPSNEGEPSNEQAVKRVQEFAFEVNYHYTKPQKIYPYLVEEYRSKMTKEEFVTAFVKERSYPYLTPFFINYESIEMSEDLMSGVARFSQAARLPGMVYELPFVYENGNYYMKAFEEFLDGSYLNKFEKLDE